MTIIIGLVITLGCLLGGFVAMGGHVDVIWQPWEYVIICGSALGTFVVANPMKTIKDSGKGIVEALTNDAAQRRATTSTFSACSISLMRELRSKPRNEVEGHIDDPEQSPIFQKFPSVIENKELTDVHLRLLPPHHHRQCPHARDRGADGRGDPDHQERQAEGLSLDGDDLGGASRRSASSPPCSASSRRWARSTRRRRCWAHLIGAALVGTFAGIFFSYAVVSPIATKIKIVREKKLRLYIDRQADAARPS